MEDGGDGDEEAEEEELEEEAVGVSGVGGRCEELGMGGSENGRRDA